MFTTSYEQLRDSMIIPSRNEPGTNPDLLFAGNQPFENSVSFRAMPSAFTPASAFDTWGIVPEPTQDEDDDAPDTNIELAFAHKFKTVNFNQLEMQPMDKQTKDGCIHYLHRPTNKVYSFDLFSRKWELSEEQYQAGLLKLFE